MPTVQMVISGRVQGVYYRASAKETADLLKITGTVKNNRQGEVEILATGTDTALRDFITWCYKGPPGASVKDIQIERIEERLFKEFSIMR